MSRLPVAVRKPTDADRAFIHDSWRDSYRDAYSAGPWPMHVYHAMFDKAVDWWASWPSYRSLVAVNPADADQIYGWLAWAEGQPPTLFYAYTKQAFRRLGVQRALMAEARLGASFAYACKTRQIDGWLRHMGLTGRHNPLAVKRWMFSEEDPSRED